MPAGNKNIPLFEDVLKDLLSWFQNSPGEFLVIGGIAVSLLSRPRTTQDIDVLGLLDEDQWDRFLQTGRQFGFAARIKDALLFARDNRILLLRHMKSGVNIDISFGCLAFEEESVNRRKLHKIGPLRVPLPTPEVLIIMKMVAYRPQDLIDVDALIQAYPKLDRKRISRWVKEFSLALERPEILSDLKRRLKGGKP